MIPRLQFNLPSTPLFAYSKRNRTGFYFDGVLVLLPHGPEISQTELSKHGLRAPQTLRHLKTPPKLG